MKKTILAIALTLAPSLSWGAAGQGFSTWTALVGALADGDLFGITDISDTSGSDDGTSKKITASAIKTYITPGILVGDCTGTPCLDGTSDGGNLIKLYAGSGSYWTALQSGVPAANRSWRLPIAAPPGAGTTQIMNMDEYGQMGFVTYSSLAGLLDGENWTFTGAVDLSGASSVLMGPLSFEGATADDYETTFSITDPTADRTITVGNYDSEIPAATAVDSSGNILVAGIADSTTEALGLGSIELGHASDTTIARSGAGAITVEGVGVVTTSSSDTLTNKTLTAPVITDSSTITFDESAADPDDADIQLSATDGVFKIAAANGANNEDLTIDLDATANKATAKSSTGVTAIAFEMGLQSRMVFNSYSSAQTLTAAAHNASIVQMTVADEVTLWDCETGNVGDFVMLWARDAEKIEVVPASGDQFYLFAGTGIGANDELDMAATAGTKVTLVCTADDSWSVYTETAACTDGGTAD